MKILAIDTSCDETSAAVVNDRRILSNVISSQVRFHKKYGGVVPFLAQRLHKERIDAVVELALQRAGCGMSDIDALAVTYGPGLAPALQVGIETARTLALSHTLPLYPINHMAGHIASCFAQTGSRVPADLELPALAVLVSGKHSDLVYFERFGEFTILGQTLDDAIGEAYDKIARMLGLGYPGGRIVAKLAEEGDPTRFALPIPMQNSGDLNLSYSGLKNAARLVIEAAREAAGGELDRQTICDICAIFEEVAQKSLLLKVESALRQRPEVRTVLLGGGVAANVALRRRLRSLARQYDVQLVVPANLKLCTDNAAMIGVAASMAIEEGAKPVEPGSVDRVPGLAL